MGLAFMSVQSVHDAGVAIRDFFLTFIRRCKIAPLLALKSEMWALFVAHLAEEVLMHSKNSLVAIIAAIFVVAAAAAPSATAAPPSDACALLTPAQVSAVVGVTVGAGKHITPTYLKSCVWEPPGGATEKFSSVLLDVDSAASWARAKAMLQSVANAPENKAQKGGGVTMTPASGIGDDAFYSNAGTSYTKLVVKKGDVQLQVEISSSAPVEKKRDMEKALAAKVLAKL